MKILVQLRYLSRTSRNTIHYCAHAHEHCPCCKLRTIAYIYWQGSSSVALFFWAFRSIARPHSATSRCEATGRRLWHDNAEGTTRRGYVIQSQSATWMLCSLCCVVVNSCLPQTPRVDPSRNILVHWRSRSRQSWTVGDYAPPLVTR